MLTREVTVTAVDDIDGSVEDVETVNFTYRKAQYSIELSRAHRDEFDAVMAPWIEASRKFRSNPHGRPGRLGYGVGREIREWLATDEGGNVIVKPTGRLKSEDMERFFRAHPEKLRSGRK